VDLFKNADEESNWVRVPVINFLRACPLPKAKEHLEELAKLDPESMKRASTFYPFAGGTPAAKPAETTDKDQEKKDQKPVDRASNSDKPGAEGKDAKDKPKLRDTSAVEARKPTESAAASADVTTARLTQPLAKNAAPAPGPPPSSLPVLGG